MLVRKQKIGKKPDMKIYYSIVKSVSGKKRPKLKHAKYLGTAERILKAFYFYEKEKEWLSGFSAP